MGDDQDRGRRFIAAIVQADPAGSQVHGFNSTRGEFFACPSHFMPALPYCDRFRTLEEQREGMLSERFQGLDAAIVDGMLRGLRENRLLISESELLNVGTHATVPSAQATSIYFPTRNRPDLVLRSVKSHADAHAKQTALRIVDDSDLRRARELKEGLQELRERSPIPIAIAGREEKARYMKLLRQQLHPDDELSLSLDTVLGDPFGLPQRIGVNRNWVLLDSVGEVFLSADDDTVAEVTALDGQRLGLALCSEEDPTGLRLYDDAPSFAEWQRFESVDLISEHTKLLGSSVGEVLKASDTSEISVGSMSPDFVRRVLSGRAMVSATALGQAGDPARAGLAFLLKREGTAGASTYRDRESLLRALTAATVVRHVPSLVISDTTFFMSTHFGLDHRAMVPPLFPVGHNDDGVFAEMLLALVPGSAIGHIPAAIRHEPPVIRKVSAEGVKRIVPSLSAFVGLLFHEFRPLSGGERAEDAFRRAGALFRSAGELEVKDFGDLMRRHWMRFLARQMSEYLQVLDRYERTPGFWAEEIDEVIVDIERQLTAASFPVPIELRGTAFESGHIEITRRLLRDYGTVLSAWPEIWASAKRLKDESVRPTLPLR